MRSAAKSLLRLVTFESSGVRRVGAHVENDIVDFAAASPSLPKDMRSFLEAGKSAIQVARDIVASGTSRVPLKSTRILAPISNPEKVICIGLNYVDHAKECGAALPTEPVMFSKFSSSIINPGDKIVVPRISHQVDFEAELVAVIGTAGRNISEENAMKHVVGYTVGHDVSARDWQLGRPGGQWLVRVNLFCVFLMSCFLSDFIGWQDV
jgi:2-keto-4-pentenoate hydratase/2-oxohepta-3-ene-1,7-dioic acid hydratase in catechol pathway